MNSSSMTNLAILADIHGNLPALQSVVADMGNFEIDHVIVAGDLINWGPFSLEVVEYALASQWAIIRGNNEFYLLDFATSREPASWRKYTLLPWLQSQFNPETRNKIAAWPDELRLRYPDAPEILVVHGVPGDPSTSIFATTKEVELNRIFRDVTCTTIVTAHTHLPLEKNIGGWHIVNPGSVGVPLDGEASASYALLTADNKGWNVMFRRVAYSIDPLLDRFEQQQFVLRCGPVAELIKREFVTARLQVIPFLRWCNVEEISWEKLADFTDEVRSAHLPDNYD